MRTGRAARPLRLIISDLDNQLGLLGWHTTSATVSAADLLLDFTDRPLEIDSCFAPLRVNQGKRMSRSDYF